MRIFLSKILLITSLFLIANYLYLEVLKKYDWNMSKVYESVHFENKDFDHIFLGASLVLDGIDNEYLSEKGIQSYNFALGGASIRTSYIQLERYLSNNKKPRVVVLGIGSLSKSYKVYSSDLDISASVKYFYFKKKLEVDNLPMIKFRGAALENLKQVYSKNHRNAEIVMGQLKTKKAVPDKSSYKDSTKKTIEISDYEGASYLFKIDSICRAKKIELIVLEMPGYKKTQNTIPVGPHILSDSIHEEIVLYNLNNKDLVSELIDSKKDWLGNSHLNEFGALKLTKYIYDNILK
jgi:hypothetical protein